MQNHIYMYIISHNIGKHETKQSSHLADYAQAAQKLCAHPHPVFQVSMWDHNFGLGTAIHTFRQEAISSTAQPSASSKKLARLTHTRKQGAALSRPTAFAILLKCLNAHFLLNSTSYAKTRWNVKISNARVQNFCDWFSAILFGADWICLKWHNLAFKQSADLLEWNMQIAIVLRALVRRATLLSLGFFEWIIWEKNAIFCNKTFKIEILFCIYT